MIWIHKLLPALVSPLAVALFLLFVSVIFRRAWPTVLAILVLLVASNPLVARMGVAYLTRVMDKRRFSF